MPTAMSATSVAITIVVYLAVLFVPGLLTGLAAGLRGWMLAGTAPLLSYAIAGLAGPWFATIGVPFTAATFAVATAGAVVIAAGAHLLARWWLARWTHTPRARNPELARTPALWAPAAQLCVLACLLVAAAIGAYTVLRGMGRLDAIPQDWDAAFHANGIRYLHDTGDGSLTGMSSVNKYGDGMPLFYPNAYHLVASVAYQFALPLAGASIPAILNANTVLLPGLLALSLVTVVREFRGRAVLAGSVALVAVAPVTLLYESMNRGPLLPFLLGLALIPIGSVALREFLSRKAMDTGLVFALCAVGLLAIHTSTLFSGILFALPMLIQRYLHGRLGLARRLRMVAVDLLALAAVAAVSVLVAAPHLLGVLDRVSGGYPGMNWPNKQDVWTAIGGLLTFRHVGVSLQLGLTVALLLGLVFFVRLSALRWIGASALLTGTAFVLVATSDAQWVIDWSQPWWNDDFRFVAMATLPLTFIAGNGLASTQEWLRARTPRPSTGTAAGIAALVLGGFIAATGLLYSELDARMVSGGYERSKAPTVSEDEARAMLELAELAKPGEWAMNDRFDGTVWTYAVSGVRTVAAHYDSVRLASDTELLSTQFNTYDTDPAVRAAVRRLNVRWVIVGWGGFIRHKERMAGLVGHRQLPFLTLVYENRGAAIYRLN